MSVQEKMSQFTCFWLYWFSKGKIRIDTKQLNSLNEESPLGENVLELLDSKEYKDFFDFLEDIIIFNETDRNPYGIYKQCIDFALAHGKLVYKEKEFINNVTKEKKLLKVIPDEFIRDSHHWLILHSRYICTARKPRCSACVIYDLCEYKDKTDEVE